MALVASPHARSLYAGIFNLILEFTEDYPNKPPNVKFATKMFHPNSKSEPACCTELTTPNLFSLPGWPHLSRHPRKSVESHL
jgi:ubiquitin-protein ligase